MRRPQRTPLYLLLALVLGVSAWWIIPPLGNVVITPSSNDPASLFPEVNAVVDTHLNEPTWQIRLTDDVPHAYLDLLVNGYRPRFVDWAKNKTSNTWVWEWRIPVREVNPAGVLNLAFFRNCEAGCSQWFTKRIGTGIGANRNPMQPTKLGVVFARPDRDWHGKAGWNVELAYSQVPTTDYWYLDAVAARVAWSCEHGQRVLLRVDYDRGQTLPPAGDANALENHLAFFRRIASDDRISCLEAVFLGSGPNDNGSNTKAPDRKTTPAWYARVFNGYGVPVRQTDNVVQAVHALRPNWKVLVGPVRAWNVNQNGNLAAAIDAPWLNYMNTLVSNIDEAARAKAAAGLPFANASGFAVHVAGRPEAMDISNADGAREPLTELRKPEWNGAQAGFRVYQDWLTIINSYASTRGLPVYINATNTFVADVNHPPGANYPPGWLTTALQVIDQEPQIQALCWFIDGLPSDAQWDGFSLNKRLDRMRDVDDEFDALLRRQP